MADEREYGLVMPFTVCQSQGGPYEDQSFVAGYELGCIDQDPSLVGSAGRYIHTLSVPQADLIAMRHGLTCEVGEQDETGDWTYIRFHTTPEAPPRARLAPDPDIVSHVEGDRSAITRARRRITAYLTGGDRG